mmetsp:Transcript_29670/g.43982  ORF Transcript_29670/g.43982 Transcript_29670/m.43982 type:complete len:574 (+) Transcript_29670:225-1946(+)
MLPHRRTTLTFLSQTAPNSPAPVVKNWDDSPGISFSRRGSRIDFSKTPPRRSRKPALFLNTNENDENSENAAPSQRNSKRRLFSARKKTPSYRRARRLVKRNTVGASSATHRQRSTFASTPLSERLIALDSPSTPHSSSSKRSGSRSTSRRSSGTFMVNIAKRKVIDASPSSKRAFDNLAADTFSELESQTLAAVKSMLHLRYEGNIPQEHPLFELDRIDPAGWDTALHQINSIEDDTDNVRQVIIFQNCLKAISKRCSELYGGAAGADMLLPALIYVIMSSNVKDVIQLFKNLRSARPSAVARHYNQHHLEAALSKMDLKTLQDTWTAVKGDDCLDAGSTMEHEDDEFNITEADFDGGVLQLGDDTAIRRRRSMFAPTVCRNDIVMQIMNVVRNGESSKGRQLELYHGLQNHGILMSCGQICYILTSFESSLRFLLTSGLTTVLRAEAELEKSEQGSQSEGPDLILCTKGGVNDAELVLRHCLLKSKALQCFYDPAGSKQMLLSFYAQHNPSKAKNVDHILKIYAGRERQMFTKLHQKYQTAIFQNILAAPTRKATARTSRKARLTRRATRA